MLLHLHGIAVARLKEYKVNYLDVTLDFLSPDDVDGFRSARNKNFSLLQTECYTKYSNEQNKKFLIYSQPEECSEYVIKILVSLSLNVFVKKSIVKSLICLQSLFPFLESKVSFQLSVCLFVYVFLSMQSQNRLELDPVMQLNQTVTDTWRTWCAAIFSSGWRVRKRSHGTRQKSVVNVIC